MHPRNSERTTQKSLEATVSDNPRKPWTISLCTLMATMLVVAGPGEASEPWSAPLQRGGKVEVDPRTNRPVFIQDGRETQLWDGVHRLEDGSVIRIQGGRVVPTTDMLDPPRMPESDTPDDPTEQPAGERIIGASPCDQLVLKVCGASRSCWREPACEAARQLREMEQEDWVNGADPNLITESGKQCQEAMTNDFFAPCP
jgi:hypothetical protein